MRSTCTASTMYRNLQGRRLCSLEHPRFTTQQGRQKQREVTLCAPVAAPGGQSNERFTCTCIKQAESLHYLTSKIYEFAHKATSQKPHILTSLEISSVRLGRVAYPSYQSQAELPQDPVGEQGRA